MSAFFKDGPAKGTSLNIQRIPIYLRVVINSKGHVNALDQKTDTARTDETIYAYKMEGEPIRGFIDGVKYSGPLNGAVYKFIQDHPDDATMRSLPSWETWVEQTDAKLQNL